MSNYPSGIAAPRHTFVEMYCPDCDLRWDANATNDFGDTCLDDDEDAYCPECEGLGQ